MKKLNALLIALLTACAAISAQTQNKVALQKFDESDLLVIRGQKSFTTVIEFSEGQRILEVTCGDKDFWIIEGKGRYLYVKPAKEGITTNLNVVPEGDVIYSFLLKEISRAGRAKESPDLRVIVNGGDDVAKLRKDKDHLEEALARSERAFRELSDKYDADKKRGAKEDETGRDKSEATSTGVPSIGSARPLLASLPRTEGTTSAQVLPESPAQLAGPAGNPEPSGTVSSNAKVKKKVGLIRAGGHLLAHVFASINHVTHIY